MLEQKIFDKAIEIIKEGNTEKIVTFLLNQYPDAIVRYYNYLQGGGNPSYMRVFAFVYGIIGVNDNSTKLIADFTRKLISGGGEYPGGKIPMIKDMRAEYNCGLKEAKDICELLMTEWKAIQYEI